MGASHLTPGGKSHRILTRLAQGPAQQWECAEAVAVRNPTERRKAWYVLSALRSGGLIELRAGSYELTDAGRDALQDLNTDMPVWIGQPEPSVRVFRQEAA